MASPPRCRRVSACEATLAVLFVVAVLVNVTLISLMATWKTPTDPPSPQDNPYLIGVGRADCTGPPAEIPLMGYANPEQTAAGIHTRLYSRAFIIDDGRRRVVFVTADVGMISQRLRLEVLRALQVKYGDLYRQENLVLSGTHTHCGPAGYFQYTLFMVTSKGFMKASIKPLVNGIVKSIDIAHRNVKPGRIYRSRGALEHSSLNRSPHSYLNNPKEERDRYQWNTDKQVLVLKFTDLDGDGIGMLSWFAVHAVSMNYTNRMVSSDNMGYASYLMEQEKNRGQLPGQGGFVAGFSSSNLGDVSPNTRGPRCMNTGLPCDYLNSSCPIGGTKMCKAFGPGDDMFDSTRIIGHSVYRKAKELYAMAGEEVVGSLQAAHQWVNMTDVTVQINDTHTMNWPLPWHPQIVDVQIITIGSVAVVAVPGEMTTMSGRRLREAVKQELESEGAFKDTEVVLAGLSNIYTHYITTYEEYQVQRYEGASTIYGPHTLSAYLQKYRGLARAIAQDKVSELPLGPPPPFFEKNLFNLLPAPSVDRAPENSSFGDVLQQVYPIYRQVRQRPSGLLICGPVPLAEGIEPAEQRHHRVAHPLTAPWGLYRIKHLGHYKQRVGWQTLVSPYEGMSESSGSPAAPTNSEVTSELRQWGSIQGPGLVKGQAGISSHTTKARL
uniref:neutral ceramidase n=1 Tax=Gasterosteus aculeatus aculeatus TaxID=481459 RepID=UPI001A98A821|nr:neutral ceramidase [Gasterosteus aculeatus aculeatus]